MRIGILTFHRAINAGAVLQAYAMQETLTSMGHETYIIDYRPEYIENCYKPIRKLDPRHPRGLLYELCTAPFRYSRIQKYKDFFSKYLNLKSIRVLADLDYVILGSDQIWNSSICGGNLDPMYFNCGDNASTKNGIAYAASTMSVDKLTPKDLSDFNQWLPRLKAIGVRESIFASFLSDKFHQKITEVLDPTLIAPKEIFCKFAPTRVIKDNYLLFYEVWHNDLVEQKAREIAHSKGLRFISLSGSDIRFAKRDIIQVFSPSDFINLIAGAQHIVTSSFHGTAFSLIFEKPFNVVCEEPHQAVRIHELLTKIGCEKLLSFNLDEAHNILPDYNSINAILQQHKTTSLNFLYDNIQ